jgi:hypothetical protein
MRIHRPTRRHAIRLTVATFVSAGTVLAGATAASANPYDITGDGVADQYQLDTDRDGFVDSWWTDVDNDGTIDEFVFDFTRDAWPDTWAVDRDHDFVLDALWIDTNGDAYADTLLPGYVYDSVWGPDLVASGTFTGTDCLTPQGGLPANVPVYGDCAWLQSLGTNTGVGPNPYDVMLDAIDAANPGPL